MANNCEQTAIDGSFDGSCYPMFHPMSEAKHTIVINLRASAADRDLIDWAAAELKMTRTSFMLWAASQRATRVLFKQRQLQQVIPEAP